MALHSSPSIQNDDAVWVYTVLQRLPRPPHQHQPPPTALPPPLVQARKRWSLWEQDGQVVGGWLSCADGAIFQPPPIAGAGFGAAKHLSEQGYAVTLLDASPNPGGLSAGWRTPQGRAVEAGFKGFWYQVGVFFPEVLQSTCTVKCVAYSMSILHVVIVGIHGCSLIPTCSINLVLCCY